MNNSINGVDERGGMWLNRWVYNAMNVAKANQRRGTYNEGEYKKNISTVDRNFIIADDHPSCGYGDRT